eukprot:jgi/Botrbrau1/17093/Bobra.0399s0003.1
MGAFTFVLKKSGGEWEAKQIEEDGDITASSSDLKELQKDLCSKAAPGGGAKTSFSIVLPNKSAVYQVVVGGPVYASAGGGGGGGGAAAAEAPAAAKEEAKKEEEEEEEDDDMGFSLFD